MGVGVASSAQVDTFTLSRWNVPAPFWKVLNLSCLLLLLGPDPITLILAPAHATEGRPPNLPVGSRSQSLIPTALARWLSRNWSGPVGSETYFQQSREGWEE